MSQQRNMPHRFLHVLWSSVRRILSLPLYIIVCILVFADDALRWSDRHLNTRFTKPKITVAELDKLIGTQLPLGSSIADVLAFLETQNIPHSEVVSEKTYRRGTDFQHSKLDGKRETIKKAVAGSINVGGSLLVKGVIKSIFYFDEHDSLVVYTVQWFGIGL